MTHDDSSKHILYVSRGVFFTFIFLGASLAGLGRMLWQFESDKPPLKWYRWIGAIFSCGFFGLITSLWLYSNFVDNFEKLAAVSLLAGLGGSTTFDFFLALLRAKFGLQMKQDEQNRSDN